VAEAARLIVLEDIVAGREDDESLASRVAERVAQRKPKLMPTRAELANAERTRQAQRVEEPWNVEP
jgi:hypothetical protein